MSVSSGSRLVLALKVTAGIMAFAGLIAGIAGFAVARDGFGYRGLLAYAGAGIVGGIIVFELAEIIRWLRKLFDKYSAE